MDDSSKIMKMTYKAQQKIDHILTADQVYELFQFLDFHLRDEGCDHTRRFTQEWLAANVDPSLHEDILIEMEDMGGFCDCEIALNCYEDYDL